MKEYFRKNKAPSFAGKFYPGNRNELKEELEQLFQQAEKKKSSKNLQALIAPHAGYVFSGKVAASAYQQISEKKSPKRIFVLASSHQYHFEGASVYSEGNLETPLGEVETDIKLGKELIQRSEYFHDKPEVFNNEHSLEVQLPFIQHKLQNKSLIIPVILGTNNAATCKKIADTLMPWFTKENLFVISSDFSHYPSYNDAIVLDTDTIEAVCRNDPDRLLKALEDNKKKGVNNLATSLCGWTSVLTLLHMTRNKKLSVLKIDYQNSGDAPLYGDKDRVVGYGAIGFYHNEYNFSVSEKEQKQILGIARSSILKHLKVSHKETEPSIDKNSILNTHSGVFVSIYIDKKLRGCIGGFSRDDKTLYEMIKQMAVSASRDKRFEYVELEETENMELEISILSPLKKIKSVNEIELGKHGIYIKKDFFSGTFLPQVAVKTGWSLDKFLGHCARDKAGIGWHGWKDAEIYTYEAFIFKGK